MSNSSVDKQIRELSAQDPNLRFIAFNMYPMSQGYVTEKTLLSSEKGAIRISHRTNRKTIDFFGEVSCIHIWDGQQWQAPSAVETVVEDGKKVTHLVNGEPARGIVAELTGYAKHLLCQAGIAAGAKGDSAKAAEYFQEATNFHHRKIVEKMGPMDFTIPVHDDPESWARDQRDRLLTMGDAGDARCVVLAVYLELRSPTEGRLTPVVRVKRVLSLSEPTKPLRRSSRELLTLQVGQEFAALANTEEAVKATAAYDVMVEADALLTLGKDGCSRTKARNERNYIKRAERKQQKESGPTVEGDKSEEPTPNALTIAMDFTPEQVEALQADGDIGAYLEALNNIG